MDAADDPGKTEAADEADGAGKADEADGAGKAACDEEAAAGDSRLQPVSGNEPSTKIRSAIEFSLNT